MLLFLVNAVLKDASNCKTDEHESEDEELPEDEVDSKFRKRLELALPVLVV